MNIGVPRNAVITPTLISAGDNRIRANVSANSMNSPPLSALSTITALWSAPTVSLTACGTMSPTNAMIPEKATDTAVSMDARVIMANRRCLTLTPSDSASSSPISNRLRSLLANIAMMIPSMATGADSASCDHLLVSNPPASQKIISR